jgi:hypothetical protein
MNSSVSLTDLVAAAKSHKGSWKDVRLAQDVKDFLWTTFDDGDNLIYPNTEVSWDDLLAETIQSDGYELLSKDEVLSVLFGLINRNRIVEGLWCNFFERGITQKLIERLLLLESENSALIRLDDR